MKPRLIKASRVIQVSLIFFASHVCAQDLYCNSAGFKEAVAKSNLVDAYFSPEHLINRNELESMQTRLQHVDVISYGFGTIRNNFLELSKIDKHNIHLLNKWRWENARDNGEPEFALVLSIGGWGGRHSFTTFLTNPNKRSIFVNSASMLVNNNNLDGIDVDWENVSLTSKAEQKGVSKLMRQLKNQLPSGSCVSNAVPATPFYWNQFPSAESWNDNVDWSVVMGYDLYGTFGPFTELASNLYEQKKAKVPDSDYHYNYPESVSVAKAVVHYKNQGLSTSKIILGVPFYCHSYYTDSADAGGYRQRVYDANISSQIPFNQASGIWERGKKAHFNDGSAYSLNKIHGTTGTAKYQFLSCETPNSIAKKVKFAKHEKLAGMSMWELSQDVNYEDSNSLLRAMTNQ